MRPAAFCMISHLHDAAQVWMGEVARAAHAKKPHMPPYDVTTFDGCTMARDTVLACCYLHDVAYHFCETREERRRADAGFRDCIIAKTECEGPLWRWTWRLTAWGYWLAVRVFGRGVVSRKRWRARRG